VGLPALAGRRVRHRLTPTGRGRVSPNGTAHFAHQQLTAQSCRGEALPRPPRRGRGRLPWHTSTTCMISPVPGRSAHRGIAGPRGPAGQAPPDPYTRRLHRPTVVGRGSTADPPPTPVGARRCLARRAGWRGRPPSPTRRVGNADSTTTIAPRAHCRPSRADRSGTGCPRPAERSPVDSPSAHWRVVHCAPH